METEKQLRIQIIRLAREIEKQKLKLKLKINTLNRKSPGASKKIIF